MAAQSRGIYFPLQSQDPPYSPQSSMNCDFFQSVWREQALFLALHMQQWLLHLNFEEFCSVSDVLIHIYWSILNGMLKGNSLYISGVISLCIFVLSSIFSCKLKIPWLSPNSQLHLLSSKSLPGSVWFLPPSPSTLKLSQRSMLGQW